jgi:repressor LexA
MAHSDPTFPKPSKRRGRPRESDVAAQLGDSASFSTFPDGPTDADGLTLRQRRILEVIKETVERRGYPPSIREMGDAVGLASSSSVAHQLKML